MRLILLATTALLCLSKPLLAQIATSDEKDVSLATKPESVDVTASEGSVDEAYEHWLAGIGLKEGWNSLSDGRRVLIQFSDATIRVGPGDPKFIIARNNAFDQAELAAKQMIANAIAPELSSSRSLDLVTRGADTPADAGAAAPAPISLADKARVLTGAKLDDEIKKYDPRWDGTGKTDEQRRAAALTLQESVASEAKARARLFASGSFTAAQFEGPLRGRGTLSVRVALIWSMRLGDIAKAIAITGAPAPLGVPGGTIDEQFAAQSRNNAAWLASASGARVWADENGKPIVLGFGSAPATSSPTIDRARASLAARVAIQRFVAETVISNELENTKFAHQEFSDGDTKVSDSGLSDNRITARSADIRLRGTAVVKEWFDVHPIGNVKMQVVVVAWTPESMAQAGALEQQMRKQESDMANRGLVPEPKQPTKAGRADVAPAADKVLRGPTANPTRF